MQPVFRRLRHERAGRTIAELLVAMAISSMVVMLINSTQIQSLRWYRRDQQTATINRPLREASNFLTRDVEFAAKVEIASGQLVITKDRIKSDGTQVQDVITYYLDNGTLMRSETPAGGTAFLQPLTRGLDSFTPTVTAEGLVRVEFAASSSGSDKKSRQLRLEIIPRSGVGG